MLTMPLQSVETCIPTLHAASLVPGRAAFEARRSPADPLPQSLHATRIADTFNLIGDALVPQKRLVHAGDVIYRAGERFECLHILNSGIAKIVKFTTDGREQVAGFRFRGDWLGLDGIAQGAYGCDGIAMDTGEVWSIRYAQLMASCDRHPALLGALHNAMSVEIARDRDSLMSVCTLPADARVADFVRIIAESMANRGMRTDTITLRMTRAEIGNHLGLTLESVSRALSRLARDRVISFSEKGRREVRIPDPRALSAFVHRCVNPEAFVLQ
jgi:CRP/FNR family transcriptional regulator